MAVWPGNIPAGGRHVTDKAQVPEHKHTVPSIAVLRSVVLKATSSRPDNGTELLSECTGLGREWSPPAVSFTSLVLEPTWLTQRRFHDKNGTLNGLRPHMLKRGFTDSFLGSVMHFRVWPNFSSVVCFFFVQCTGGCVEQSDRPMSFDHPTGRGMNFSHYKHLCRLSLGSCTVIVTRRFPPKILTFYFTASARNGKTQLWEKVINLPYSRLNTSSLSFCKTAKPKCPHI